ncbi:MAG: 50S ribosomal protein L23 [Candidatus Eisenbacteria bacterium]|nr:50S ribosomal protein L23 [Candidatus Eisenbacteria bacterium]
MIEPRQIVRRALVTEKGTQIREAANQYLFEVDPRANKLQIKKAIETIFSVKVENVRTVRMKGKTKRLGAHVGRRPHWKKAIVTLKKGQTIELFEQV